jgi:molybdopterin converting factor small subunit
MATTGEMRVRILQLGRQVIDYRGQPGQTVAEALAATNLQIGSGMDIRVNGAAAEGATPLHDGDVVTIIPRIKGGRGAEPR